MRYKITTHTSDMKGAGTDANVTLVRVLLLEPGLTALGFSVQPTQV